MVIKNSVHDNGALFGNLANDGEYHLKSGVYKLKRDFYSNSSIVIDEGADVTIDLAGNTLNRNLDEKNNFGTVLTVKTGAKLRVIDSTGTGLATIKGGYSKSGGGALINYGTINIDGASFENNTSVSKGGAIWTCGNMTIKNAFISKNSTGIDGGGINSCCSDSYTNCTISSNKAKGNGGALNAEYGSNPICANDYDPQHHFWATKDGNVNGKAFY